MSAIISVDVFAEEDDGWRARVQLIDKGRETLHEVTVIHEMYDDLSGGDVSPEELVRASFAFLLDREPQEAILRHFELGLIERYFPEYRRRLRDYYRTD